MADRSDLRVADGCGLEVNEIRERLDPATLAQLFDLSVFTEIDSTSDWLLRQAPPPVAHYRVAAAEHQTAGRGRHGKPWELPPGAGVCLSMVWRLQRRPSELAALTLVLGIAAIDALASLGFERVELKWPNDLIYENGKLGGILVETSAAGDDSVCIVAGIGVNCSLPADFRLLVGSAGALAPTDLATIGCPGKLPGLNAICAKLINAFAANVNAFIAKGFEEFHPRWSRVDWLKGKRIEVLNGDVRLRGSAAGVGSCGELLLRDANSLIRIHSGSIVVCPAEVRE